MNLIDAYTNKRVDFKYSGAELSFRLSHALFSSYSIDAGSRLLLKTIAKNIPLNSNSSILDVGTGIGVIGLSIQKAFPGAKAVLQDRDALAVQWAKMNAEENGMETEAFGGLALEGIEGRNFDLIVSNLPAKAGNPVLRDFFFRAPRYLAPGGTVAVVIVHTLADLAKESIADAGHEITYSESNKNYTIFHFKGGDIESLPDPWKTYNRGSGRFFLENTRYGLNCVWSLPEFDTVAYGTELAAKAIQFNLKQKPAPKTALFWEPGQGHLAVWYKTLQPEVKQLIAGRDKLALKATAQNLEASAGSKSLLMEPVQSTHIGDFTLIPENPDTRDIDLICLPWQPVPEARIEQKVFATFNTLLSRNGSIVLYGKSAAIQQLIKSRKGFIKVKEWKNKGHRAVLLRRNTQ